MLEPRLSQLKGPSLTGLPVLMLCTLFQAKSSILKMETEAHSSEEMHTVCVAMHMHTREYLGLCWFVPWRG